MNLYLPAQHGMSQCKLFVLGNRLFQFDNAGFVESQCAINAGQIGLQRAVASATYLQVVTIFVQNESALCRLITRRFKLP